MRNSKGQSLVEVVVGLAIMVIVILGLVSVTTVSVRNAGFSRNQMLATKYAQEGMEKVRAFRDQNPWLIFTAACDAESIPLAAPPAPFSLLFDCSVSGENREIIITVSWSDDKGTHESRLTTELTNWK